MIAVSKTHFPRMIPARRVAELIGIKTATLANWRCLGKGPSGWVRESETLVVYPEPAVREYLERRSSVRTGEMTISRLKHGNEERNDRSHP